ncbi:hypothetical protein K493DRAFT_204889 [Basidiobolus meristosporus CBS 931.73]|uniref:Cyclin N-terminal domain-containing protein n=1 Tax=Basidiobolus meristosporus CBS 931.73 TaxID=1314790 RepID=A0A1Y1Z5L9_9FUNG|eukprot:ORY05095.1 hypothetical protein K493DRAFT_204889 [Basidiobolus meristosporus CBS 931.73]
MDLYCNNPVDQFNNICQGSTLSQHFLSLSNDLSPVNFVTEMVEHLWHCRPTLFPSPTQLMFTVFCKNIITRMSVLPTTLFLALKYIHRIRQSSPNSQPSQGSEYQVFITSLILAHKFLEDDTYTNQSWSDISKIPVEQINKMERHFLKGIGYNLNVSQEEFIQWVEYLEGYLSYRSTLQMLTNQQPYVSNTMM